MNAPVRTARELADGHGAEKLVLVASRRTDMPRFHLDELLGGLRHGVLHPQGPRQPVWELRFTPADIHSVGLWSQDFGPWLARRREIEGYRFWYRFTILPDDPVCKPRAPGVTEQLDRLAALCESGPPEAVFVFIDPLVRYRTAGEGEASWRYNFSAESLAPILRAAGRLGIRHVTTSIVDRYARAERRARERGVEIHFPDPADPADRAEMRRMLAAVRDAAASCGLALRSCCEPLLAQEGLGARGSCVDGPALVALFGPGASTRPDRGQRHKHGCGCTVAVDVGRYAEHGSWSHHCGHDCPQCYARP
ncbi:MAG: DUF1848 family protein [Deltaproteobacteria bacterium]|nr:DUF1848 family protein [Deltaproteobacteria bacterium]